MSRGNKSKLKSNERLDKLMEYFQVQHNISMNPTGAALLEQLIGGPKTVKEILSKLSVVPKTIRYWLDDKMNPLGVVRRCPNLDDMRSFYYVLQPEFIPNGDEETNEEK